MRWVQELALLPRIGEARVLLELRREMGPIAFSAQYQQSPIPPGGTIIKRKWLASYDEVPTRDRGDHIIMSWDIALSDEEKGDYLPAWCCSAEGKCSSFWKSFVPHAAQSRVRAQQSQEIRRRGDSRMACFISAPTGARG